MNLSPAEVERFYSVWKPLLHFVNQRRAVVPGVSFDGPHPVDAELAAKVRDALWADPSLLDDFIRENPAGLSADALALASTWRHRRAGNFIVYRSLKRHTVVLEDVRPVQVFGVHGLSTPIERMVPWLPCMVGGVLLPFGDRIIFDGLLSVYSVRFGPGIRSQFADSYREAGGRIITTLGPAIAPADNPGRGASRGGASPPKKRAKPATKKKPADEKALTKPGRCEGCGEAFSKRTMARHEAECEALHPPATKGKESPRYTLVVEAPGMPEYWLHVEVGSATTLREIDRLLRDTWMECCGHLSAFTIAGVRFASTPDTSGWGMETERSMGAKVSALMDVPSWGYEYDYGTTTKLRLRPSGMRLGSARGVRLLARNLPPPLRCVTCGEPATRVCSVCRWEDNGLFCAKHAKKHPCSEDHLLPVVNSPRAGMCGYTG